MLKLDCVHAICFGHRGDCRGVSDILVAQKLGFHSPRRGSIVVFSACSVRLLEELNTDGLLVSISDVGDR